MSTERRLRQLLLVAVVLMALGASAELVLAEHTEPGPQLIPFVLSGLGSLASALVLLKPTRVTLWGLRSVMVVCLLGGLFGIWEHLEHNLIFQQEIRPNAPRSERLREAIFGGNPLLAPGMFAFMALLGAGAAWRHPEGVAAPSA